jgi:uncharacterized membrane-anchored protein
LHSKLPEITLAFWLMKICATTLGETTGDLFSMTLGIGYLLSTVCLLVLFVIALGGQLRARSHHPTLYWTVILATSTAGTTMSDFLDRTLHLGYPLGATLLMALLIGILAVWQWREGSISLESVKVLRIECYYWAAILVSNTLGTALGDFLSDSSGLGYAGSALLIGSAIGGLAVLYFSTGVSRTVLFWGAFVLTRPLGAEVGDFLTKTSAQGGLGFGTLGASGILGAVLVILVARSVYLEHRKAAGGRSASAQ